MTPADGMEAAARIAEECALDAAPYSSARNMGLLIAARIREAAKSPPHGGER